MSPCNTPTPAMHANLVTHVTPVADVGKPGKCVQCSSDPAFAFYNVPEKSTFSRAPGYEAGRKQWEI